MTVVARRVASIPARLASDTWLHVIDLIAPEDSEARTELIAVTGEAASIITREGPKDAPIVITGQGPRLRIYCVYGDEAVEGEKVNETPLASSPTQSDAWKLSLPCPAADLSWVQESLQKASSRVTARDAADTVPTETTGEDRALAATINMESFLRE